MLLLLQIYRRRKKIVCVVWSLRVYSVYSRIVQRFFPRRSNTLGDYIFRPGRRNFSFTSTRGKKEEKSGLPLPER